MDKENQDGVSEQEVEDIKSDVAGVVEDQGQQEQQSQQGQQDQQVKPEDKPVTQNDLLESVKLLLTKGQAKAEPVVEVKKRRTIDDMKPEEIDQTFQPVATRIKAEHLAAIKEGGEPAMKALVEIMQAGVNNSVRSSNYLIQQLREEVMEHLDKQFAPFMTSYQQEQIERLQAKFYSENEDLKPYEAIVKAVALDIRDKGEANGLNNAQINKLLVSRTKEMLKKSGIELKAADGSADTTQKKGGIPRPANSVISGRGSVSDVGKSGNSTASEIKELMS